MEKLEVLKEEINYINNPKIKESLCYMIEKLPDYFFTIAAASTGKYHPEYAQGEGGLLRHSKAAVRIGYELLSDPVIGDKYTSDEKDLMLMGLLIHDGLKLGHEKEKYTRFDHPILMAGFVEGNEVFEKPKTKYQNFVHMCDYLASRKCILVPFDKDNNITV